jgi:hypothetical protein
MAEALGIKERLLKKWVSLRLVPYTKVGRTVLFDPTKVEVALEKYERQPAGELDRPKKRCVGGKKAATRKTAKARATRATGRVPAVAVPAAPAAPEKEPSTLNGEFLEFPFLSPATAFKQQEELPLPA